MAGLALAALALLASLLRDPFGHPRVLFLFASGADLSGNVDGFVDQPGIAFPGEEQAGLDRARLEIFGAAGKVPLGLERWRSAADMRSLGLKLVEPDLGAADVAVIMIVAAGVSEDGEARLCWNFGRSANQAGRVRVADLLQQITVSTRACKLVILDAGSVESLPQQEMLVNAFPRFLERDVHKTGDESLWVLCSHTGFESSHVLESLRRSVFGYYVEQGLSGAADINGDHRIDVGELHSWVAHAVAGYVDRRTAGMQSQTPQLLWGGGPHLPAKELPAVVPVRSSVADGKSAVNATPAGGQTAEGAARTAQGAGTAVEPTAAASGGTAETANPSAAPSSPQVLLQEGWGLTERLRHRTANSPTVLDVAPRLFGELVDRLRAAELLARGTNGVAPVELSNSLLPVVVPLRGIAADPPVPPGSGAGLGSRLARQLEPPALPALPVLSLALAEHLAEARIRALPEGYQELGAALDKFIGQDERAGFDEWLEKLKIGEQRLAEVHGLAVLAAVPDLNWTVLRGALAARRVGEQAAASSLGSLECAAEAVRLGDRRRNAGEKLLVDGVQPERNSRAAAEFEAAVAAYRSAERRSAACLRSLHLKNDLVARAREYVRWRRAAASRSDTAGPQFDHVAEFLVELRRFCDLVEAQTNGDEQEIADLAARMVEIRQQIEAAATEDSVLGLVGSASSPEDLAQIEALLATSFVPAALRPQLQAAGQAAANVISLDVTPIDLRRQVAAPRTVLQRQRQCLSQQVRLELLLAKLADVRDDALPQPGAGLKPLTAAAEAVHTRERACADHPESTERVSAWWDACADFGRELATFYQQLPPRLNAAIEAGRQASVTTEAARIRRGFPRTLALLPPRADPGSAADGLLVQARLADWRELLAFLRQRAIEELPDASAENAEYLTASAESCRQAALALGPLPPLTLNRAPSLRLSGEAELSLSQEAEGELTVTVQNRRNSSQDAWIVADYDRELLDVRFPADYAVYRESAAGADEARPAAPLYHPAEQGLPPSLTLAPGAARVLKFVVRRRGSRTWPTKLIVKAAGEDCDVRQECTVHVPAPEVIELAVAGPDRSWTPTPTGFVLHPFPNQRTAFQLLLRNRGPERVLGLELFPLERRPAAPLPAGTLPRDQAEALLRNLSLGPRLAAVAGFKLEGDGALHAVAFTGPPPPDPDKPPAGQGGAVAKAAGTAKLPLGALVVISEAATGKKIVKHLDFAPQRPRRYVLARVDYQPDAQLIDIVVRRRENAASPERIRVGCELGSLSNPLSTPRRVAGEITAGQTETRFTLPVPTAVEGLRLAIAVDDYPRAFLYRISSRLAGGEVPEDTGSLAVRVTAPEPSGLFACPLKFVDAAVEVDAPPGSLPEGQGFWEVGIDKDLDRELTGDAVVRFSADRQAQPELSGYFSDGRLAIDTQVGDFQVQLPAEGLCDQRALVVAHASVLGRNAWSVPVEIILDGAGPRVTNVAVGPAPPLINGQELEVAATVVDGDLSGVARVDVSFDLEGTGRFAKEPPPLPAALSPAGGWTARLPTEKMPPGSYMILLRATDKVGNVGEYRRAVVTLYSKQDVELQRAAVRVAVRGVVEYNKMPVPGVKVSLVPVEADPKTTGGKAAPAEKSAADKNPPGPATESIPPATTDKDGMFVLPRVPLGKFKLQAAGIFRNKIRKAELEITVDEQTPFGPAPRLKLP
jgi:hypothetical protein